MTMLATDVAAWFGLKRYPRSWRGGCPVCGYPDTFIVREGGDQQAWAHCFSCQDRAAIAAALTRGLKQERLYDRKVDLDVRTNRLRNQEAALRLWHQSAPAPGTPADSYLKRRGLPCCASSAALRFHSNCPHPEGGKLPALVALVFGATGDAVGVHRTYITRCGCKASVTPAKASLGPIWGGAIRLDDVDPKRPLVISEGLETAASAGLMMSQPAWAAISAGNLAQGLALPPNARRVLIAADPDATGQKAARDAWMRWSNEGRHVRIALPDSDRDFNDLLLVTARE
jgi:putative DNA primase/helicase